MFTKLELAFVTLCVCDFRQDNQPCDTTDQTEPISCVSGNMYQWVCGRFLCGDLLSIIKTNLQSTWLHVFLRLVSIFNPSLSSPELGLTPL